MNPFHIVIVLAAMSVVRTGLGAQQRDPRTNPVPIGTGEISGIVWSGDATPQPIHRAVVSISGGGLPAARSVITDNAGRFVFGRLPAGEFTIGAKKAAYLPTTYGSLRPGRPGSLVTVTAGQRQSISLTMFKGAVISGTLRDATGQPVSGVSVNAVDARTASSDVSAIMQTESVTSDDRGVYRIYGLMPGEYYVVANPISGGDGGIGARSQTDMDAVLASLTQRQNRTAPAGTSSTAMAPIPVGNSVGYAPVFFPGTALYTEAATIRVAAGEERESVNFDVRHVRVASITGTISGDVANFGMVQLAIIIGGPRVTSALSTGGITSKPANAQGEFQYGNLPPGSYRIVARARRGSGPPSGGETVVISSGRGGGSSGGGTPVAGTGAPAANVEQLFAVADVEVREQDVTGVALSLQPGGTMTGRLVFDVGAGPTPADFTGFRVALNLPGGSYMMSSSGGTVVGNSYSSVPAVPVNADGTFQIIGIGPGPYAFTCALPATLVKTWKLRTAVVDGRDLLDGSIEGPNVQFKGVTVTLSDKTTELAGALQSASGQPVSDYYVVAFSTDRANWRTGSRRNKSAKPGADGRYAFTDLPAGEYFVAALTDLDPLEWQTPAFLDQVFPAAVKVTVAEGEKKTLSLQIK